MEFHIGSSIHDRNGEQLGKLTHVIVDPETKEVVDIVADTSGLLGREVIVPVGAINQASEERIDLAIDKDQTTDLKDFLVSSYIAPTPETFAGYPWAGAALVGQGLAPVGAATGLESIAYTPIVDTQEQIPEGDVDIKRGTEVWATDGKIGAVREVVTDEQTKRVRALVVRHGFLFHKDFEIPTERIANIGADRVTLKIAKADVESR